MARRRQHRTDLNQASIVRDLRRVGCEVHIIERPLDLLVGYRGVWCLIDIKNREGRGMKLTPDQEKFFEEPVPKGPASIAADFDEAWEFIRSLA